MEKKKIAHLHLVAPNNNPFTLVTHLSEDGISHKLYSGHGSSGTPNALSNLGCTLPVEPNDSETEEMFVQRLIDVININSTKSVVKRVATKIQFAQSN